MNNDYTHITIVIDRSGSMAGIKADAQGGINTFLTEQKALPGKATITMVDFDDSYEVKYTGDLQKVPAYVLTPRGSTALNDAIGKSIVTTGELLAAMDEADRPAKVIVCIVTDGCENSSREWAGPKVKEKVTEQETKYGWVFQFIGANIDAVSVGGGYGIQHAAHFHSTGVAARGMMGNISATIGNYRNAGAQAVYQGTPSVNADGTDAEEDVSSST